MPLTEYQKTYGHTGLTRVEGEELIPLQDQVLLKVLPEETETHSGLIALPQTASKDGYAYRGLVVAIGAGDRASGGGRKEMSVEPGDIVLYERRPWAQFELNGEMHVVVHEEQHILCVVGHEDPS